MWGRLSGEVPRGTPVPALCGGGLGLRYVEPDEARDEYGEVELADDGLRRRERARGVGYRGHCAVTGGREGYVAEEEEPRRGNSYVVSDVDERVRVYDVYEYIEGSPGEPYEQVHAHRGEEYLGSHLAALQEVYEYGDGRKEEQEHREDYLLPYDYAALGLEHGEVYHERHEPRDGEAERDDDVAFRGSPASRWGHKSTKISF